MTVIVFPGQGSQMTGMGKDFFDSFQEVKDIFGLLSELTKINLEDIIFNNPFIIGFVTNILNVKAFMFIVSLFTFIDLQPNSFMSLIYLFYFPLITFIWVAFVSFALTHETLGVRFNKYTNKIQIASSLFIIILGVIILIETIYEIF